MKNTLFFAMSLVICFIVACNKSDSNSTVWPVNDNITVLSNNWDEGLVDHNVLTNGIPPVPFEKLYEISYSQLGNNEHYRIVNDGKNELMQTVNANLNNIDGIFIGMVDLGQSGIRRENLIISLVKIAQDVDPSGNCTIKMNHLRIAGQSIFFKCINQNTGEWKQMTATDPLLVAFNKKKVGIFIGKENLLKHIFTTTRNSMYLYTGIIGSIRHFVAVNGTYFTPSVTVGNGTLPSPPKNPIYLSTINGIPLDRCNTTSNFFSNHGTIRPCPNNCPQ